MHLLHSSALGGMQCRSWQVSVVFLEAVGCAALVAAGAALVLPARVKALVATRLDQADKEEERPYIAAPA